MDYKITGYEPEKLFHFFEEISAIPRGSGNEKGISDYLVKFAKDRGLEVIQDDAYNVVIKKAGSRGAEDHAPVMLQGHMDMVCEKRAGVEHDFEKDGLDLIIRDGRLTANGTTLGGDNGVAVALMLMVLDDDEIEHPPVECVFTTEEEVGLNGAKALDKSVLKARTMINMDSEDEGVATVSCAGGLRVQFTKEIKRTTVQGSLLTLKVEGLLGGHSGQDIDKERQNADLLMARMIQRLLKETKGQLVSFNGGTKDNAIPRECEASLIYESDEEAAKAEEQLHLIIVNNGQCIEKVRLKELNEGTKIKNHLGISNVRKRLELYYGEDTAVYFENILSGGVKVHLFIPIQGGNDDADSSS